MFSIYIRRYKDQSGQIQNSETLLMTVPFSGDDTPISNPVINTSWDAIGSFDFELTPDSPYYNSFLHMKTVLRVVYEGTTIFYGRVLSINESPLLRTRKIKCEDAYAFLGDIYYKGVEDNKRESISINAYVTKLINHYNSQYSANSGRQFVIDNIPGNYASSVPSEMRIDEEKRKHGKSSWDTIKGLLDSLPSNYGGHWHVHYEESDGKIHLDWYKNYFRKQTGEAGEETIEVTRNLIDITNSFEVDNIFTRVIPLGNSDKGNTLTIEGYTPPGRQSAWNRNYIKVSELVTESLCPTADLNVGYHTASDYENAENNYDVIYKTVDFSNAYSKDALWKYAIDWIKNNYLGMIPNYNIKAIDMHVLGSNSAKHLVGDQITISYPDAAGGSRKIDVFTIKALTYDLFHPENWQYTMGYPSEMLDHEYGERRTKGNSTSSPNPNRPKPPTGETTTITPHNNIKSSINELYCTYFPVLDTEALDTYTPMRAFKLRNDPVIWLVGTFRYHGTTYGVGVREAGTFDFVYNPPVVSVPTVHRWYNQVSSGAINMVSEGGTNIPFTVDTLVSAFDAGTASITVNGNDTAPTVLTAIGGSEVPTTAVDQNGNTTTVPAAANESDGVILNDTVTYEDSSGNTQTRSGFITAVDLRFADQNNSAQDIPSFKTDYARIKQLVVEEIYAQYIDTDEAHVGTHLYSWEGHFKSIDANNIKGIDVVQGKNLLAFTGPQSSEAGVIGFARPASDGTYTIVNSISQDDFVGIIKKLEWTDQQHVNFLITRIDGTTESFRKVTGGMIEKLEWTDQQHVNFLITRIDGTTESFRKVTGDMIASVEKIDGGETLRLNRIDGTHLDFRKVTISSVTLTGSWSGGGKLTVNATADPNGTNTYSVTPTLAFAGNGTSNFRVNMSAADSEGTTSVRKYISGSLAISGSKENSVVNLLNSASNVVATISCADIYQEGLDDGGGSSTPVTITIPNVYYTAEGDTPPSGSDGATAATTISNYVANQYGNGGRIYFRVLAGGVQKWYYITLPTIA